MEILTTLNSYSAISILNPILTQFSNDYVIEYGTFYSKIPPNCPRCGLKMNHNGSNTLSKKNVARLKVGKYQCPKCKMNIQESREFFENLYTFLQDAIAPMVLKMRWNKMSYRGIEEVLEHIFPIGKDTIYELVRETIESTQLPEQEKKEYQIIGYDEQYVRINGQQKYRILIYDFEAGFPIIDTIVESKTSENIKAVFLQTSLNFLIPTIVVTDLDNSYPRILDELFGENLIHQPCLFHLQKLICEPYSKNCSLNEELLKYRLLNIFYDHDQEISCLISWIDVENELIKVGNKKEYNNWLKNKKSEFKSFCKSINLEFSRCKKRIHPFEQIMSSFIDLLEDIEKFPVKVQKRLKMMDKMFIKLSNFCDSSLIPATNNAVENYFFRTLNMDWKKRMRSDEGFLFHLKLHSIRLAGIFREVKLKFTDLIFAMKLFSNSY